DPMLGYLTTSFKDHPRLRRKTGRQASTKMKKRFVELGVMSQSGEIETHGVESLYAMYQQAGGDTRTVDSLREEAARRLRDISERGFELGVHTQGDLLGSEKSRSRIAEIYDHARRALYAMVDDAVIDGGGSPRLRVRTKAKDRDDYLSHPTAGET